MLILNVKNAKKQKHMKSVTGMDGDIVCPPYWRVCGGTGILFVMILLNVQLIVFQQDYSILHNM